MTTLHAAARGALLSLLLVSAGAQAAEPTLPSQRLEELADTAQSLLEAHQRIAKEEGAHAADDRKTLKEAEDLLRHGRRKLAAGNAVEAQSAFQQAYQMATALVIGDRTGRTLATSRPDQYATGGATDRRVALVEARIESIRALTDAYRRVADEKQISDRSRLDEVGRKIEAARAALVLNRFDEARREANAGYELASSLVVGVRQGDTLVKTLAFESPAEEYRYELDRHASYKMLLRLAMAEEGAPRGAQMVAERAEIESALLSEMAETEAQKGRWAEGVKLLEKASATLMQAIRASGKFIPG